MIVFKSTYVVSGKLEFELNWPAFKSYNYKTNEHRDLLCFSHYLFIQTL